MNVLQPHFWLHGFMILNYEWLAFKPLIFCVSKNIRGMGISPSSRYFQNEVARKYDACQTTILLE